MSSHGARGQICETVKNKGCAATTSMCLAACKEMSSEAQCRQQMLTALECMAKLPETAWDCGESGFPELRAGHCEGEQERVVTCLMK